MGDLTAAAAFVTTHGDLVERGRLARLAAGIAPSAEVVALAADRQTGPGGWPAPWSGAAAGIEATCLRLAQLDDLDALDRPAAARAVRWLVAVQRSDGTWAEDVPGAPPRLREGPRSILYLTAYAGWCLATYAAAAGEHGPVERRAVEQALAGQEPAARPAVARVGLRHALGALRTVVKVGGAVERAAETLRDAQRRDGSWDSYPATTWLAAALLHRVLAKKHAERASRALATAAPDMPGADAAWAGAALRRLGTAAETPTLVALRVRLAATQRPNGSWDDDVHTTLRAIRALA